MYMQCRTPLYLLERNSLPLNAGLHRSIPRKMRRSLVFAAFSCQAAAAAKSEGDFFFAPAAEEPGVHLPGEKKAREARQAGDEAAKHAAPMPTGSVGTAANIVRLAVDRDGSTRNAEEAKEAAEPVDIKKVAAMAGQAKAIEGGSVVDNVDLAALLAAGAASKPNDEKLLRLFGGKEKSIDGDGKPDLTLGGKITQDDLEQWMNESYGAKAENAPAGAATDAAGPKRDAATDNHAMVQLSSSKDRHDPDHDSHAHKPGEYEEMPLPLQDISDKIILGTIAIEGKGVAGQLELNNKILQHMSAYARRARPGDTTAGNRLPPALLDVYDAARANVAAKKPGGKTAKTSILQVDAEAHTSSALTSPSVMPSVFTSMRNDTKMLDELCVARDYSECCHYCSAHSQESLANFAHLQANTGHGLASGENGLAAQRYKCAWQAMDWHKIQLFRRKPRTCGGEDGHMCVFPFSEGYCPGAEMVKLAAEQNAAPLRDNACYNTVSPSDKSQFVTGDIKFGLACQMGCKDGYEMDEGRFSLRTSLNKITCKHPDPHNQTSPITSRSHIIRPQTLSVSQCTVRRRSPIRCCGTPVAPTTWTTAGWEARSSARRRRAVS